MFSVLTVLAVLGVLVFFLLVPVKRSVGYVLVYVCCTLVIELNVVLPSVNCIYVCVCFYLLCANMCPRSSLSLYNPHASFYSQFYNIFGCISSFGPSTLLAEYRCVRDVSVKTFL